MSASVIRPDEGNLIDLPGVGPCPRPVDVDQSMTGFARLKSVRAYRFAPGATIEGESEADEVLIVVLEGAVTMEIAGAHPLTAPLSAGCILYMPPDHTYRLMPHGNSVVAYGRTDATGARQTEVIDADAAEGEALRLERLELTDGESLTSKAEALALVATGAVAAAEETAGPLSVVASGGGEDTLSAIERTVVWLYSI